MSQQRIRSFLFAVVALAALGPAARGAFVVTLQQVGPNVVATGSGTINTAGLTPDSPFFSGQSSEGGINAGSPYLSVGPATNTPVNIYDGISGPSNFGMNDGDGADSGSGSIVTMYYASRLYVPAGYTSGSSLSDTSTFLGETFASLGVTPGTYTWTWGAGPTADSLTLNATVPEPASLAMVSVAGLLLLSRTRRSRQ